VVLIDSNPEACRAAEAAGFRVLHGSGLEPRVQIRAELDTRAGALGATANEEVNLLFARHARKDFKIPRVWAAVRSGHLSVTDANVRQSGGHVLFGAPRNLVQWTHRLDQGAATVERWRQAGEGESAPLPDGHALPLAVQRGRRASPVDEETAFRRGDELYVAVDKEAREEVAARLGAAGWQAAEAADSAG
jgi:Trk K+ transport system NAD-binding subunit